MRTHPLIDRVQDSVIRKILEDYNSGFEAAVAQAIAGMSFTISGSGGGGQIRQGDAVRLQMSQSPQQPGVIPQFGGEAANP